MVRVVCTNPDDPSTDSRNLCEASCAIQILIILYPKHSPGDVRVSPCTTDESECECDGPNLTRRRPTGELVGYVIRRRIDSSHSLLLGAEKSESEVKVLIQKGTVKVVMSRPTYWLVFQPSPGAILAAKFPKMRALPDPLFCIEAAASSTASMRCGVRTTSPVVSVSQTI